MQKILSRNSIKISRRFFSGYATDNTSKEEMQRNLQQDSHVKDTIKEDVSQEQDDPNYKNMRPFNYFEYQGLKFEQQRAPYEQDFSREELYGNIGEIYESKRYSTENRKLNTGILFSIFGLSILIYIFNKNFQRKKLQISKKQVTHDIFIKNRFNIEQLN